MSKKARITLTNSAAYVPRLLAKESCLLEISGTYVYITEYVGYVVVETELISVMARNYFPEMFETCTVFRKARGYSTRRRENCMSRVKFVLKWKMKFFCCIIYASLDNQMLRIND